MPKDKWFARADVVRVEVHAKSSENVDFSKIAEMDRTFIEKFNETRTYESEERTSITLTWRNLET